ncbi:MAG: NUDIX domain-containing protein [Myxococcales bacterium FL481]|nr:MAG: NUDIX domain-containing protein [Myxococcales bacterium FL481]
MSSPSPTLSPTGPRSPVIRVFDCHICRPRDGGLEFLLLRRAANKVYAGTWRMVGGKLKPDETAWQACLREIAEETQLRVRRLITVPYVNRFYEWQHDRINDIPVFLAVTDSGAEPILDEEHTEAVWVSSQQANDLLPWPAQREGLLAAEAMLLGSSSLIEFLEVEIPVS